MHAGLKCHSLTRLHSTYRIDVELLFDRKDENMNSICYLRLMHYFRCYNNWMERWPTAGDLSKATDNEISLVRVSDRR